MVLKKASKVALTVSDFKAMVDQIVLKNPKLPVMIGFCGCGSRVISFQVELEANCPACGGSVDVRPMMRRPK
jgi:hypothetical protein